MISLFNRRMIALLASLVLALVLPAAGSAYAHAPAPSVPFPIPELFDPESTPAAEDMPLKPVQVFDVEAGKVVHTVPNDDEFQQYAKRWLLSVKGLSPKVSPDAKCGYVYRVPLGETYTVRVSNLSIAVSDVYLFYCKRTDPVLLVFDPNNKPYLLTFEADLKPFLRKIASASGS